MIDKKQIEDIAFLARLTLGAEEKSRLSQELSKILTYVEQISELDLQKVSPMAHAAQSQNIFREDQVKSTAIKDAVFKQAPEQENGFFVVPRVIQK